MFSFNFNNATGLCLCDAGRTGIWSGRVSADFTASYGFRILMLSLHMACAVLSLLFGGGCRVRTCDTLVNSQVLCQLS